MSESRFGIGEWYGNQMWAELAVAAYNYNLVRMARLTAA